MEAFVSSITNVNRGVVLQGSHERSFHYKPKLAGKTSKTRKHCTA